MSSSDYKLIKTVMDVETLTSLLVSICWIGRKLVKENYMSNPSRSTMSYVKFTAAIAASIAMSIADI